MPQSACPHAPDYDISFSRALAAEIERLPPGSPLETAIADCYVLRQQVRTCNQADGKTGISPAMDERIDSRK